MRLLRLGLKQQKMRVLQVKCQKTRELRKKEQYNPPSPRLHTNDNRKVTYAINRAELPRGAVELCKRQRLEARIDWLAFKGQHTEDAFMYPAERLLSDKSFESFNAKSKLAERQRAFG